MCGILGVVGQAPVNQLLYDGLQVLQHRGQDAAGIVTTNGKTFHMHKGSGMVRDVFRTRNMRSLLGTAGIAHVRYPTAGSASCLAEAQPFYVNSPFGIVLAHNGNLTNTEELKADMFRHDLRHINTNSDSEVLLNVFAHELTQRLSGNELNVDAVFGAIEAVHRRVRGAYAVVAMIAGYGLVAFRDPNGIRPLVIGTCVNNGKTEYMFASESVALDCSGFNLLRDVQPGEGVFVGFDGEFHARSCASDTRHAPCLFEYVYFARPDSVIDGASVYQARIVMGEKLAEKIRRALPELDIDVVMPIPDTSRPSALQLANHLGLPYREGFIKNRYIGRTFIMPGQAVRKKSVRQKLNPVACEFKGRNVLLVDDSIVRGTTSKEIVQMARDAGAKKVYFASAAPAVRFPNVYGIDMPTRAELLATGRNEAEIAEEIGADAVIYQDLSALEEAVSSVNPKLSSYETSCFNGEYITGDITPAYLDAIEADRLDGKAGAERSGSEQMIDLNLNVAEQNLM
ncbi:MULTISPECIES: amidophosphoribosyltransferase [Chromobacterium]|uniref:Amidophosphoribosyltransferase n=2 Tax=Chromobacterium haemolyticum TaxID=394935 RepID=A0A1W0CTV1_9NEIS|nr:MULTISPECIES: amidophosphoribosyltransferase [Chromobacterium]OQS38195.1 amidophosphoribosyltransferase [Chromobacterium haemolyticum]QOZ84193.1 amidophosphoribosyltransferase [Chromobacterium sp. Rain0013]WON84351.1 amidophosphoribosyltransferase [Chromobacterium haemolyticum]